MVTTDSMEAIRKVLFNEGSNVENRELKCVICCNCLCVPPILENSVFGTICGRKNCNVHAITKGQNNPQTLYESVAKYLIFPCMYKDNGCATELNWEDIEQHEETCIYKNFCCPLSMDHLLIECEEKCDWIGDSSEFISHMEAQHSRLLFLNKLKLNFRRDYTKYMGEMYFTIISEDIAVVMLYMNENKNALFCKVWAGISIYKNLQCHIKIVDENVTNSISLKKQDAVLLRPGVLKYDETCNNCLKIDLKYMENFLENPYLIVISFIYNGVETDHEEKFDISLNKKSDSVFNAELREAKCDKCSEELCPPVFICFTAHNICAACRKNNYCPKCSSKLATSRNIAFEKLKLSVNQPCINHSKGCDYKAPYPIIKSHEKICPFNLRKCIFKCDKKFYDLLDHLRHHHPRSIASLDVRYTLNQLNVHIFVLESQVFVFTKRLATNDCFFFTIVCLGMKEVRYKFHLSLTNDKFLGSEITLSHICHPELVDFKEYEKDGLEGLSSVISVPYTVLEQIFPDIRNTTFKLNIQEITTLEQSN